MTDTPTTSDLRALKLTEEEWHALMHMGELEPNRAHLDMLVLAGLAVRTSMHPPAWDLTEAGHEACNAIDFILDWDDFAFKASESPSEDSEEPAEVDTVAELLAAPGRISVGSLVRHQHHGEGLVTDHFMWDGDWGGFRVKLLKPSQTAPTTSISEFSDRADAFTLIS